MKQTAGVALNVLLRVAVILTTVCVLVPLLPSMPAHGLDPSWHYGLNEAVARGLSFGKDIIFTFGPYASIYTRAYHPSTEGLMIGGSLYFSLAFSMALILALKGGSKRDHLIVIAGLAVIGAIPHAVFSPRDPFIFFYPLLVSVYLCGGFRARVEPHPRLELLVIFILLSVFGLIALIKISIFLLCGSCLLVSVSYFLSRREYAKAFTALASPAVSTLVLWVLSGQSLVNLPHYFRSMVPIVSGYSGAMSLDGALSDILVYLAVCLTVLWVLFTAKIRPYRTLFSLVLFYSLSLFVVFKAAFVRHDNHAFLAGNFLVLVGILLVISLGSRRSAASFVACCLAFFVIANNHLSIKSTFQPGNLLSVYTTAWRGLELRWAAGNVLLDAFREARSRLHAKADMATLPGTSDIYSWEQSRLLASGNSWNPRPVFQSYTVYTPSLARKNREHLRGENAPDNVFFKIHPIDNRLPSLEDGASWPELLVNYEATGVEAGRLLLKNRRSHFRGFTTPISLEKRGFNEAIEVPGSDDIVFARVTVKQSWLGRVVNLLYKTSPLEIRLVMRNGATEDYRFVADMAVEGILISPLIRTAEDFELIYVGQQMLLDKQVLSFSIAPARWRLLWENSVEVEFQSIDKNALARLSVISGLRKPEPYRGGEILEARNCAGELSYLNGFSPSATDIRAARTISLVGWLAADSGRGLRSTAAKLILSNEVGAHYIVPTERIIRRDLVRLHDNEQLIGAGYSANANISGLEGDFTLNVGYESGGSLYRCRTMQKTIIIDSDLAPVIR